MSMMSDGLRILVICAALAAMTACESRDKKLARLRHESEVACRISQATKHRMDSTFGHWMTTYPDTLLVIAAAYGDTIEKRQAKCDLAAEEYDKALRGD